ncbi:MAG: DUF4398 domain-containing protein [Bdellovibrionia bacterium]
MMILGTKTKGVSLNQAYSLFILITVSLLSQSCSLFTTRPVQDMSQTSAALRAAKEVQADVLAPELFRQASEFFFKAKREYKFKNFNFATIYAQKARRLAEEAEFESLRNGGNRTSEQVPDPLANSAVQAPAHSKAPDAAPENPYNQQETPPLSVPAPQGTPVEEYERRKAQEDEIRKRADTAPSENTPPATSVGTIPGVPH